MTTHPSDDSRLHKLCRDGNEEKVVEFVGHIADRKTLEDRLANEKGVFGYTPLHEAVASGRRAELPTRESGRRARQLSSQQRLHPPAPGRQQRTRRVCVSDMWSPLVWLASY